MSAVSIEKPLTKLWVCTRCGELWELLPAEQPARGYDGLVLCGRCCEFPDPEIVL